jgi:glycosyltransferase involved in cell wall biosynthesis
LDPGADTKLIRYILNSISRFSLNISLLGVLDGIGMKNLYSNSGALIYPSLVESFGLPLLEAKTIGMPIIAADLQYVWDVVEPAYVFNPHDKNSISRAIKKYLDLTDDVIELKPSIDLLNELIQRESKPFKQDIRL